VESFSDYISTREASERYGISPSHLTRLLKSGAVKGKKIGHDWLVYEPSLKEFIKNRPRPGPKPKNQP
jgi:excisionase family DNA binding protein